MKKKIIVLLAIACVVCFALWLVACNPSENIVDVENIELDETQMTLTEGEDVVLTATITPIDATDKTVLWSSSDLNVASVDDNGKVTAIYEGVAHISATSHNDKSAVCIVIVEAKEQEVMQHVVTFHATGGKFDNGKDSHSMKVNDGNKLTPVVVSRGEKYIFAGWYTDEYLTRMWNMDEYTVNDDTTLYASWKYVNDYQSVIDALANRIKTERQDNNMKVEILSIFTDNGNLCFVEKDSTGVFSYATDISNFDEVVNNADVIAQIPTTNLTLLKNYNDDYNSESDYGIAYYMVYKYTHSYDKDTDEEIVYSIIYSCVSEWEEDTKHFATGGPWYICKIRAIIADKDGKVFDYTLTVITGIPDFDKVLSGLALSETYNETKTPFDKLASDFYAERVKELEA